MWHLPRNRGKKNKSKLHTTKHWKQEVGSTLFQSTQLWRKCQMTSAMTQMPNDISCDVKSLGSCHTRIFFLEVKYDITWLYIVHDVISCFIIFNFLAVWGKLKFDGCVEEESSFMSTCFLLSIFLQFLLNNLIISSKIKLDIFFLKRFWKRKYVGPRQTFKRKIMP